MVGVAGLGGPNETRYRTSNNFPGAPEGGEGHAFIVRPCVCFDRIRSSAMCPIEPRCAHAGNQATSALCYPAAMNRQGEGPKLFAGHARESCSAVDLWLEANAVQAMALIGA